MAQFRVTADKIWHSGECRHYFKGDVITLPDTVVPKEGGSVEPIKPTKKGKAEAEAPAEGADPLA